ncbi:MAG: hypothetical protein EWM73_03260 [Nitrospira sp.]|nr:MAG: hypothetical protein EWM73_03260 [Nitrospira sp.]
MFTVILPDAPYATGRSWNGLRFAEKALDSGTPVCVFLFSDAVYVARKGQCPPDGTLNLEDLLIKLVGKGATVSVCTTCVEARPYQPSGQSAAGFSHTKKSGLDVGDLVAGAKMGTMAELVGWCRESQQVISF